MTEQFDSKLVEQAVEAGGRAYAEGGGVEDVALAAVYAVAPALMAQGAECSCGGSGLYPNEVPGVGTEWVGCPDCNRAEIERRAYQRGMVEGAREVFVAVDWPRNCDKHERVCPYPCAIDAAREAVARIEKGGA